MKQMMFKITFMLAMILPITGFSQSSNVAGLFDKYSGSDGFTTVDINKGLFELFAEIEADDPEFDDFQKAIEGLESMRLIAYSIDEENGDDATREGFIQDIKKTVPFSEYKELMVVKDKDVNVNFYAKSEKQIITEMLMVVDGKEEAVLLSLLGVIDLNYVAKLGTSMNMGGMKYLGKMQSE